MSKSNSDKNKAKAASSSENNQKKEEKKKDNNNNGNNNKQPKKKNNNDTEYEHNDVPLLDQIKSYDDITSGKILKTPFMIQQLLDEMPYNTSDVARCPKNALESRSVHCLDGAILAAAALEKIGFSPGIVFLNADNDDGHCLATFKVGKFFGAVAKSNFTGIRFRPPVFVSIRELCMTYFYNYFNINKKLTLRSYTNPVSLKLKKFQNWETDNEVVLKIEQALYDAEEFPLVSAQLAKKLDPVDDIMYEAGILKLDMEGCYQPE